MSANQRNPADEDASLEDKAYEGRQEENINTFKGGEAEFRQAQLDVVIKVLANRGRGD